MVYDRFAQRLKDVLGQQPKKKYGIERLKMLEPLSLAGRSKKMAKDFRKMFPHYVVSGGKKGRFSCFCYKKRLRIGRLWRKSDEEV